MIKFIKSKEFLHKVFAILAKCLPLWLLALLKSQGHREGLDGDAFSSRSTMARIEVRVAVGGTGSLGLNCIGWPDLVSA